MLKKIGSYVLAVLFGAVLACVLGYITFGQGYSDSIRINEQLVKSLGERDAIIIDLEAARDSVSSGIEPVIVRIDTDGKIIDQLIETERVRQEAIKKAIRIIEAGRVLE